MKRYVISSIIGGSGEEGDDYRVAVADHGVSYSAVMPDPDPVTGAPKKNWALVLVSAADLRALLKDARIDALPDFPLDGKVSGINGPAKTAMLNAMTRRGISTGNVGNTDGFRDIVRHIGQQLIASFDESNFDVQ